MEFHNYLLEAFVAALKTPLGFTNTAEVPWKYDKDNAFGQKLHDP